MSNLWFNLVCDDLDDNEGWGTDVDVVEVDEVEEPELWTEDNDLGVILVDDSFNDIGFSQ